MSKEFLPSGERSTRRPRFFARFLGDRRGSTAIEFAMLALPFALLVFAILESCVSFAGQEVMANVTDDIARQLRTGQLRAVDVAGDLLKDKICAGMAIVVSTDCKNNLTVDLRQYASFADAAGAGFRVDAAGNIVLTQGTNTLQPATAPGLAETRNMLRVFYKWPVMTDLMAKSMSNMGSGYTLHFTSVTWQNEPFDD